VTREWRVESGKRRGLAAWVVLTGLAIVFIAGCGKQAANTGGKMIVAASIAPLADFSRQVGGDRVEVELLVPPGSNPHVYQVQPAQMALLSKASVLVLNGLALEFWANNVIDAANNPKLIVVRTAEGLSIIDHSEEGGQGNPHVWVDPIDAIHQVEKIRDAFSKADPSHASEYAANAAGYISKLRKLDGDIRSEVAKFKSKSFVTFHPTWVYFAKRYGLVEAATIEPSPGKEPSPRDIAAAVDTAKRLNAKAIFTEPQMSPKAAQVVAEEVGAKVLLLDAFGKPPDYDYIATMRNNLRLMAEALQ
jgi:zinc transport system substrate-binding protein